MSYYPTMTYIEENNRHVNLLCLGPFDIIKTTVRDPVILQIMAEEHWCTYGIDLKEIEIWLTEQNILCDISMNLIEAKFSFYDKESAMAFKLRWA